MVEHLGGGCLGCLVFISPDPTRSVSGKLGVNGIIYNEPETGGIGVFSNIQCAMLESVLQCSILRGPGAVVEGITHTKPKT